MSKRTKIAWISLLALAVLIKILSFFPPAVEKYYATGIYPFISRFQRSLFGWLPFSVGDIFYAGAGIWMVWQLCKIVRTVIRRQAGRRYWLGVLRRFVFGVLVVYVWFNLAWGLNYDRLGIANQLGLNVRSYDNRELQKLVGVTVDKMNALDSLARIGRGSTALDRTLLDEAVASYGQLAAMDPRFAYKTPSVKPSLVGILGNYLGFSGYYNPFTGEAQVNTYTPVFTRPFTACHEIGHAMGYGKENEANMAGYLSSHVSADPAFRYSVYFDMYYYAARELYVRDSCLLVPLRDKLHPAIRKDFRELRKFYDKWKNPFEPIVRQAYGAYLRNNSQPQGMHTYNEVVAFLIAYGYKYGFEKI